MGGSPGACEGLRLPLAVVLLSGPAQEQEKSRSRSLEVGFGMWCC